MPPSLNEDALLEALRWRCAVKKFDPSRKVLPTLWDALEESLRLAHSSFGLQPWKFIVVDDPAVRVSLRQHAAYNQAAVTEASHLVVLAYKKDLGEREIDAHLASIAKVRNPGAEALERSRNVMLRLVKVIFDPAQVNTWSSRQVYLAFGVLLTSAAVLGVDACPIEGIDPQVVDKTLGLDTKGLASLALCAVGYRATDDAYSLAPKVRFDRSEVIVHV